MIERLLKAFGVSDEPSPHATELNADVPRRPGVSIAQEAFLLSIDQAKGKVSDDTRHAVAAGLLVELAHEGRLEVTGEDRGTRMTLSDPRPLGDRELDVALKIVDLGGRERKVVREVSLLAGVQSLLRDRLIDEGLVVEETSRRWGVTSVTTLRASPQSGREELVHRLQGVLVAGATPDDRTALLVAVVDRLVPVRIFVEKDEVKQARKRAAAIAESVPDGVRALIAAVNSEAGRGGDFTSGT